MSLDIAARNIAATRVRQRRTARQRVRLLLLRLAAPLLRRSAASTAPGARASPTKIVLIRPDHLGDLLFATPALHMLRTALPESHLTALVGPWGAPVLRGNSDVDEVVELPFPGFARTAKPPPWQPYALLNRWAARLRQGHFDAAIVLRGDHWWGALLAALARIPRRVGYAVAEAAPFLTEVVPCAEGQHEVEKNLWLAERLQPHASATSPIHWERERHPLRFHPSEADREWAAAFGHERMIAIHPGAGAPVKMWRAEKWSEVAAALGAEMRARVFITGAGPAEAAACRQIAEGLRGAAGRATVLAGQTSLGQLAAFFGRCLLVLGPDSGPLHLAVAMGAPTVHLYGPASVEAFGPWGDPARHRAVRSSLGCAPCGILDWPDIELHPCVREIEVGGVLAAARQVTGPGR